MKASTQHTIALGIWLALVVPTVLFWRDSVFWVNVMSLYAILATHWAGRHAARAKEAAETNGS